MWGYTVVTSVIRNVKSCLAALGKCIWICDSLSKTEIHCFKFLNAITTVSSRIAWGQIPFLQLRFKAYHAPWKFDINHCLPFSRLCLHSKWWFSSVFYPFLSLHFTPCLHTTLIQLGSKINPISVRIPNLIQLFTAVLLSVWFSIESINLTLSIAPPEHVVVIY